MKKLLTTLVVIAMAATHAWADTTYDVSLTETNGTDTANWTIDPTNAVEGTTVTVTYSGTKKVKSITAVKKASTVAVTAITLNKTTTTIAKGSTETLSVSSVTPDDATDKTVTWSSDNESVATVDENGVVTAVAMGTANITATAHDGSGVSATCAVTVNTVVRITQSDFNYGSFTKDGVTVRASMIDPSDGNLMEGGSFSTSLGNFTKIQVSCGSFEASGSGWSKSGWSGGTWTGNASTVSFSGNMMGMGMGITIVCTIVPAE